jgi:magnesium transporter
MTHSEHLDRPALEFARGDVPELDESQDVEGALATLRRGELGERIVYLYVVDSERRLVGVLPVRRLLHASPHERIGDLALRRVVSLPASATVLDACELFLTHRFLALPLVDEEGRLSGVVDVTLLTDEIFDLAERQEVDDLFETIGFRVSQIRGASPWRAFRLRFPWLIATIAGGSACAVLAGLFEATLQEALILAFFLTLVLGLAEAVAVQSLAITIPALRHERPEGRWYTRMLRREILTATMLGGVAGTTVAAIAYLWRGEVLPSLAIGLAILLSLLVAAILGLSVPSLLHRTRLDPTIAAGPVALALTDIITVSSYLGIATWLLGG